MKAADTFHEHLDVCAQCRGQVFNLCPTGLRLLEQAATEPYERELRGLMQWNNVLRNGVRQ